MKAPTKTSIAVSLLILVAAAVPGWMARGKHADLRSERARLITEGAELGIFPEDLESGLRFTSRRRGDERETSSQAMRALIGLMPELGNMHLTGMPDDDTMNAIYLEYLTRIASLDASELKILIDKLHAEGDMEKMKWRILVSDAMDHLVRDHPQAALEYLSDREGQLPDSEKFRIMNEALKRWATDHPKLALEWFRANSASHPQGLEKESLLEGAARSDMKLAFGLIGELGIEEPEWAFWGMANHLKNAGERTEFLRLLRDFGGTQPDKLGEAQMKSVLELISDGIANDGFEAGSRWITENNLSGSEAAIVVENMGISMKDGEQGRWIEWMAANVPDERRDGLIESTMTSWSQSDGLAAGEWLASLPDGFAKAASVAAYAKAVAPHEPQTAGQWALSLQPGPKRTDALKTVYAKWPQDSPENIARREAFMAEHPAD